jgi:hypothetical protein
MRYDMHSHTAADVTLKDVEAAIKKVEAQKASHARNLAACKNDPYDSIETQKRNYWKDQLAVDEQQLGALRRKLQEFTGDGSWSPASSAVWHNETSG